MTQKISGIELAFEHGRIVGSAYRCTYRETISSGERSCTVRHWFCDLDACRADIARRRARGSEVDQVRIEHWMMQESREES